MLQTNNSTKSGIVLPTDFTEKSKTLKEKVENVDDELSGSFEKESRVVSSETDNKLEKDQINEKLRTPVAETKIDKPGVNIIKLFSLSSYW